MKFFSYESRFSQLLLKLCYSCYLNLLWLVCSLPIFTMGAATTALYYTCLKVILMRRVMWPPPSSAPLRIISSRRRHSG